MPDFKRNYHEFIYHTCLFLSNHCTFGGYGIAKKYFENEMKELAIKIKNGEITPFFKNEIISDISPEDWTPYLYLLEKIQGEQLYYYAFISNRLSKWSRYL